MVNDGESRDFFGGRRYFVCWFSGKCWQFAIVQLVYLHIKNGDFFHSYASWPEAISKHDDFMRFSAAIRVEKLWWFDGSSLRFTIFLGGLTNDFASNKCGCSWKWVRIPVKLCHSHGLSPQYLFPIRYHRKSTLVYHLQLTIPCLFPFDIRYHQIPHIHIYIYNCSPLLKWGYNPLSYQTWPMYGWFTYDKSLCIQPNFYVYQEGLTHCD